MPTQTFPTLRWISEDITSGSSVSLEKNQFLPKETGQVSSWCQILRPVWPVCRSATFPELLSCIMRETDPGLPYNVGRPQVGLLSLIQTLTFHQGKPQLSPILCDRRCEIKAFIRATCVALDFNGLGLKGSTNTSHGKSSSSCWIAGDAINQPYVKSRSSSMSSHYLTKWE